MSYIKPGGKNMTKTLFIEKRGCDFWKDDQEMKKSSDLENYRLFFRFTGKDGIKYIVEAGAGCCYRFNNKRTGKPLKKPIREHNHKLYLSLQYEKDGMSYGKHPSTDGLNYCKADLLKIINNLSCYKFTDIKFVEKV